VADNKLKIVLMADDDTEDCWLATEAFLESGAKAAFCCVLDGIELMEYLSEPSRSEAKGLPSLILLDLNMPRKNGADAMIEIRSEAALQQIPIIILTTSNEEDVPPAISQMADGFITKPATFEEWIAIMKSLAEQWLVKSE
jgi:CheY-like chemotaxis protein